MANSKVNLKQEEYPYGRLLFGAACIARGVRSHPEQIQQDWDNWEGDFMSKYEWNLAGKTFFEECKQRIENGELQS